MIINQTFELSMTLDTDPFRRIFDNKVGYLKELDDEYLDTSLAAKGITIIYRNSRYKKKVRVLVNTAVIVDDPFDTDKLIRKLDKRISEYFDHRYTLDDLTLSGVTLTLDINVGSREKVSDYLKVLQRIGKVKGFSPVDYDCFDDKTSFCLSGNSNNTDFLLYNLEQAVTVQLLSADAVRRQLQSASEQTKGILRAEVRLTKPKAVWEYADATNVELTKLRKATASSTTHGRLRDTQFYLQISFKAFLNFCKDSGAFSEDDARDTYCSFSTQLHELVQAQEARFRESVEVKAIDYLALIRDLYRGDYFRVAKDVKDFKPDKHDGLIYYNCLCLRGKRLEQKLKSIRSSLSLDACVSALLSRDALKLVESKNTVQINGTGGKRFYAIKLNKLR